MEKPQNNKSPINFKSMLKKMAVGFLVSQALAVLTVLVFFDTFWAIKRIDSNISLLILGGFFLVVCMSAIASYFWSKAGISLKVCINMVIVNAFWLWILLLFQPQLSHSLFFIILFFIGILLCAILGAWFGKRVLYE